MECEFPRINSNEEEVRRYLTECRRIAVVGASPNPEKDSHRVTRYLIEHDYTVYPIYPKGEEFLGQKYYRSLKEIPEPVDMVVVFRKPEAVGPIADACIERGDVKVLWTQKGIVNNEAAEKAREHGINVVQNMCAMVEHRELIGE
ncbi:CoA-binding protein [Nitratifractor salsuginis]|uniref:CoA-binding domain protein n=1 Tax=Nitratifractor salsuginis (strain DSM 16511 / JCM 12458 / E9I37-1) TaxID=749222 RepID=E6X0M3_NITSE|nr:CoA-binding protein [Nitratifractor salsuginis]ADV45743.1 CoA-binding domain protein [Nitratifractor salsuginis DSM 16511]